MAKISGRKKTCTVSTGMRAWVFKEGGIYVAYAPEPDLIWRELVPLRMTLARV